LLRSPDNVGLDLLGVVRVIVEHGRQADKDPHPYDEQAAWAHLQATVA
jgi:hypothetical protein